MKALARGLALASSGLIGSALAVGLLAGGASAQTNPNDKNKNKPAPAAPAPRPAPAPAPRPAPTPAPVYRPPTPAPAPVYRPPAAMPAPSPVYRPPTATPTSPVYRPPTATPTPTYPGRPTTPGSAAPGNPGSAFPSRPNYPTRPGAPGTTPPIASPGVGGSTYPTRPGTFPTRPGGGGGAAPTQPPHTGGFPTRPGGPVAGPRPGNPGIHGPIGSGPAYRTPRASAPAPRLVRPAISYQHSARQFYYHGAPRAAWRVPYYRYPRGYSYVRYYRGQRFPLALILGSYIIYDYASYGFAPPPPGQVWVRYGGDAVLVDQSTGDIGDTVNGAFDESLPAEADGAPQGYDPGQPPPEAEAPPPPPPSLAPAPDLPRWFSEGRVPSYFTVGACNEFFGNRNEQRALDGAWQDEDWNEVVRIVARGRCRSNLSSYLLGMASEAMNVPVASSFYSLGSRLEGQGDCRNWNACRGVDVGSESYEGMRRTR